MSRSRRSLLAGGTYFFTVVTYRRQAILCDEKLRNALRSAIESVRISHPFTIEAWVLLPDHLHCIWTLPEGDADFSTRWMMIKRKVSIACAAQYKRAEWLTGSKQKHRESTIWQRRFWEHQIRDGEDYAKHLDYLHYNPAKHGLVDQAKDSQYLSFHRYEKSGLYDENWGSLIDLS
jgi:putative transposase